MHLSKKAFTLIELVVVVTMIWILIMATTVYLWWADEKRKIIEAQWCASTIHGELSNFVFYALTSKNLKIDWNEISPDCYRIGVWSGKCIDENDTTWCGYISLNVANYSVEQGQDQNQQLFKTLNSPSTCHKNWIDLRFIWHTSITANDHEIKRIIINKWLTANDPFIIDHDGSYKTLTGEIIVLLCLNSDCNSRKEISKYEIDWRSWTISLVNCKRYSMEDSGRCELREGDTPTPEIQINAEPEEEWGWWD